MVQWITVVLALLGFAYNGYKDYTNGNLQPLTNQEDSVKTNYPIQYCLMAYDPNSDKVYYQHENGTWYDDPPQQRRYASTSKHSKNKGQETLGVAYRTQGGTQYPIR